MTAVVLKPCDSYSLNELIRENRVQRDRVKILAVPLSGQCGPAGFENRGVLSVSIEGDQLHLTTLYGEESEPLARCLLERCTVCRGGRHAVYDELLCPEAEETPPKGRPVRGSAGTGRKKRRRAVCVLARDVFTVYSL